MVSVLQVEGEEEDEGDKNVEEGEGAQQDPVTNLESRVKLQSTCSMFT